MAEGTGTWGRLLGPHKPYRALYGVICDHDGRSWPCREAAVLALKEIATQANRFQDFSRDCFANGMAARLDGILDKATSLVGEKEALEPYWPGFTADLTKQGDGWCAECLRLLPTGEACSPEHAFSKRWQANNEQGAGDGQQD